MMCFLFVFVIYIFDLLICLVGCRCEWCHLFMFEFSIFLCFIGLFSLILFYSVCCLFVCIGGCDS